MNRFLILITLLSACVFQSCDNTLNLFAEPKEIPVVYGLISTTEPTQYIRIEKGFLDNKIPATELAQDAKNLYYDNATATLKNSRTNKEFTLQKVDAVQEGYVREDGFFAKSPNFVYRFNVESGDFKPGDNIKFNLLLSDDDEPVEANIDLLSEISLNSPNSKNNFGFSPDDEFTVRWLAFNNAKNPPVVWDVDFIFRYQEADLTQEEPEWVTKEIRWQVLKNVEAGNNKKDISRKIDGLEFYKFLNSNLEVIEKTQRQFLDFDVEITSGDGNLLRYIDVLKANTGITSSQPTPIYSNLSRGLGLLAARNIQVFGKFFISSATIDFLQENELTKGLNFK